MRLIGEPANTSRNAGIVERGEVGQARRASARPRQEVGSRLAPGELVPRADREAVVAAIDAVADSGRSSAGIVPLVLDREVGDAAPRIEPVGRGKRRRRAGIQAAPAGPAVIGRRRVGRQIERRLDLAEEQPGAEVARHQVGVLALPAQPGRSASGFSITGAVSTKSLSAAGPRLDPARERLQPRLEQSW